MNLGRYSAYWARLRGDSPALVFRGEAMSWAEFDRSVDGVAASLQRLGVVKGDRVGVLLNNCVEWAISYAAVFRIGALLVPLNPRYGDNELKLIDGQMACAVVVSNPELIAKLGVNAAGANGEVGLYAMRSGAVETFSQAAASGACPDAVETQPSDPAAICFTSGSTGLPKGAVLSHEAIMANAHSEILAFRWTSEERVLLLAPFAFTGGVISVFTPAYVAGACTYIEEVPSPERALELILQEGITSITAVPILFERIAACPGFEAGDLSRLRTAITGGAPVSESLLKRYAERGVCIRQTYGCTEGCGMLAAPTERDALAKPWSCGWALPSVDIRIVDAADRPCGVGEAGEILLRGIQVTSGYWNNPEANAQSWLDGWYRTGDMGLIDEDGHLRIVDRKKSMIITGGVNVYPAEVERGMSALPDVAEVIVFGRPDDMWGERVVAVVYGPQEAAAQSLLDACKPLLGSYKAPKELIVSDRPLPRTTSGKISRGEIDRLYASLADFPRATAAPRH